jgi:hypothetical protein
LFGRDVLLIAIGDEIVGVGSKTRFVSIEPRTGRYFPMWISREVNLKNSVSVPFNAHDERPGREKVDSDGTSVKYQKFPKRCCQREQMPPFLFG